jgi:hypothetical protein
LALVTVSDVEYFEPDEEALLGFWLDQPIAGSTSDVHALSFEGWALGREDPAVALQVSGSGLGAVSLPVGFPRPDVAELHPGIPWAARGSGFRAGIGTLGLPRRFELLLSLELKDKRTVPLATIRGRRNPLTPDKDRSGPQPILVTTVGRSGSSWVMELLGRHPRIVSYPPWRREVKAASYWAEVLLALGGPASYLQPVTSAQRTEHWWLGQGRQFDERPDDDPAIERLFGSTQVREAGRFCRSRINAFYRQVARSAGKQKPRYFAEKCVPRSPAYAQVLREIYPGAREIFLVRDFRDVFCSILAFNERLGYPWFGREKVASDEEYARRVLSRNYQALVRGWNERSQSAFLLRYEDLVLEPESTLRSVLSFLNLGRADGLLGVLLDAPADERRKEYRHGTSATAKDSIGRWRKDLEPSLKAVCNEAFGESLATFGYMT